MSKTISDREFESVVSVIRRDIFSRPDVDVEDVRASLQALQEEIETMKQSLGT